MGLRIGDLVKLSEIQGSGLQESTWRGIVIRKAPLVGGLMDGEEEDEWVVHWLHHPVGEECFEYGYYLEVISESH